jgi:hypothetical protein
MIITLVFKKNANFFAENWGKSQKIVIITSTPGHPKCGIFSNLEREVVGPTVAAEVHPGERSGADGLDHVLESIS